MQLNFLWNLIILLKSMFEYYLLFENQNQYINFCNMSEDCELFDNLNIDVISDMLCGITKEYPIKYIQKMNSDYTVAIFRNEIFRELNNTVALALIEEIFNKISSLSIKFREISDITNNNQKNIVNIHIMFQYFELLKMISKFLVPFNSIGLSRASKVFNEYLPRPELKSCEQKIYKAKKLLDSYLKLSIEINRFQKKITFSNEKKELSESFKALDCLCHELTGLKLVEPFTIVDNVYPTLLEEFVIESILKTHEDLRSTMEGIPDVQLIWDEIISFKVQISFYYTYLKLMERLREKHMPFCFPSFDISCHIDAKNVYDLSLAVRNINDENFCQTLNDVDLNAETYGFILTGANQGGKTTYLRSTGMVVYLAMCGCPVPAESASLYPYKKIYTLFSGEEIKESGESRFEREVKRYLYLYTNFGKEILVLLNEFFIGTNRLEGVEILGQCICDLIKKEATFGCVTHYQKIYKLIGDNADNSIRYLQSRIFFDNDDRKKYIIKKGMPDGRAYSERITEKYGMTYRDLLKLFNIGSDDDV